MTMGTPELAQRQEAQGAADYRPTLRLWLRLLACTSAIEKRLQRGLAAEFSSGLTRFDILAALDRNPDGMTMSALAEALLVSNGNVTGRVQMLRRDGYVEVNRLESDQRVSIATLTPEGREHFAAMAARHHRWVEEMFADLPPEGRAQLFAMLGDLRKSILASGEEISR
ncbi:MAG: MarR family transcriptional regulator [Erythrobacter sp.]|jgi:DNA-binding MarR family transcriptional regulator|nr:MarR family transcriptional regulator [Erythrobacter sp.]